MKKLLYIFCICLALIPVSSFAQMAGLHGDFLETRSGLHAGNQFRTTFYNDGTFGVNDVPPDIGGEWPINSGHIYMLDGNVFVGSEVFDTDGVLQHIHSTVRSAGDGSAGSWSSGDMSPDGQWWTFLPLPGFASPDTNKIAMSKWPWAWPNVWPDKINDPIDPGWRGSWNGYFGKNVFNADEESFFVADDYANAEYKFYPDSTDLQRRGLGLRMWVRGFQWSNALVEDALFALFDLENIGTFEHDKMVFGYKFGNNMGDTMTAGDANDDNGAYNKDEDVAYLFDYDDIGAGGWTPVGYFGGAFLESPGNPFDGIDNDGDGQSGSGPTITRDMFTPRTLQQGSQVVIIDYKTFKRQVKVLTSDTIRVQYQDQVFKFYPGKVVEEIPNNLVDDNLNGLIDESNGSTFGTPPNALTKYLFEGAKYIDYVSGNGTDNPLIEERRDDGIDNDGDWNALTDDLGADGAAFTSDPGEKDGLPTYGEPHFDKTDIDETDMIGLTSFTLYYWPDIPHYDDEKVWTALVPGYLDDVLQNTNVELLYGSGYFPMKPGQVERFSMGIMCGSNLADFLENKHWVARAYSENYNFSKAPNIPTLTAVRGDHYVTLYWNDIAELSEDPIAGKDFEGYRIYRSTDPGFKDMIPITDGAGSVTYRQPLVQFDLNNEYSGYSPVPVKGVLYWLGNNSGIVHSWTDSTARNGQTYYYAIGAYDHGIPASGIAPSECSKFISISTSGAVDKGSNVVILRAEAPAAGYVSADLKGFELLEGGFATGSVGYKIIDPTLIKNKHQYEITFEDTTMIIDTRLYPATKNMSLTDVTDAGNPKVIIDKTTATRPSDVLPMTDGFLLSVRNDTAVTVITEQSKWSKENIINYIFRAYKSNLATYVGTANDFRIDFGEVGIDTATAFQATKTKKLEAVPVNFTITNTLTGRPVDFALYEKDGKDGRFTAFSEKSLSDVIIFLEKDKNDSLTASWEFSLDFSTYVDTVMVNPSAGDFVVLKTKKPFLSRDKFVFSAQAPYIDPKLAQVDMDRIKVVPNPYVVANSFEPTNPYANGRGPRELHFIHLPAKCTVKIFNIRGQLVKMIEHNNPVDDGTEVWDMQSKDNLDISYGVYVYYVDAGETGTKIGKFAIIK
jgi:hypothetical protein